VLRRCVALAFDPSVCVWGGKVMEHDFGLTDWAGGWTMLVCPLQIERRLMGLEWRHESCGF